MKSLNNAMRNLRAAFGNENKEDVLKNIETLIKELKKADIEKNGEDPKIERKYEMMLEHVEEAKLHRGIEPSTTQKELEKVSKIIGEIRQDRDNWRNTEMQDSVTYLLNNINKYYMM